MVVKKSPSTAIKTDTLFQGEINKANAERGSRHDLGTTLSAIDKESATSQAEEQQLLSYLNAKTAP